MAALCAVVLLAISVIVYTPLHHDDPGTRGACPFCHFQGLGFETAQNQVQINVPAAMAWRGTTFTAFSYTQPFGRPHLGRAPPSFLLSA